MTTTTLHAHVQRSRFAHHTVTALAGLLPVSWRLAKHTSRRSASESAGLEAQRVRDMACAYTKTDPGFAADLYAAASRHEAASAD